jgi:hypothetical protein
MSGGSFFGGTVYNKKYPVAIGYNGIFRKIA